MSTDLPRERAAGRAAPPVLWRILRVYLALKVVLLVAAVVLGEAFGVDPSSVAAPLGRVLEWCRIG